MYTNNGSDTFTFTPGTWYTIKIITDNGLAGGTSWYVNGALVGTSGGYMIGNGTYFGIADDGATANFDNISISGASSASDATPTFRKLVAADFPTLNQNSTGNAATATLATAATSALNITASSNTSLTSLSNLNTVGTLTSGTISLSTNVKTSGTLTAGTVTYPNAHNSTAGQVLTINASGTATWTTPASSGGGTHTVGEAYGGGIVFYITTGGLHGLIADTYENGNASNEEALDFVTNPTYHNSTYNGNLYTDWRVPTYYELTLLYAARATPNLNMTSGTYLSCTYTAYSTYKNLKFSNNSIQYENANWVPRTLRAIRSF